MTGLYDSLIVIDGLVISKWSRAVFADRRTGGLTAANCTCSIWEGFAETMRNIARWKRWFTENAGLRLAGVPVSAGSALPFGPFLALATWLVWLFGPVLM
jgi:hypothetical protein